ncbi:hypothetical protein Dip510_001917 [Elusimicrobium posterum]|uniref:RecB family exonuclease n=1 Tax=Elusimicrobium posterum TaxID=3116653 RepID=UPI003C79232F
MPLSVEFRTTLDIDKLSLISIIDRIDYLGNGRIAITDYKTGKTVQREPDQLYMYQKVMEASPVLKSIVEQKDGAKEVKVERMSFYHLPSLKVMDFDPAPTAEINTFWTGVLKTADDIRAEIYTPAPDENKCRWCDYKTMCPVFTGVEYEAFQKAKPMPKIEAEPVIKEDILADKIDRLGKIQQEEKDLKQEITTLMTQNNYNQHFGKSFKASLETVESLDFADKQAVVDLLKNNGLLKKTLVPTLSSVTAVLKDPATPQEVKQEANKLVSKNKTQVLKIETAGE